MTEQQKAEKEYLSNVYINNSINKNPFIMRIGSEKEMFFFGTADNPIMDKLDKQSKYRGVYETVIELKEKIDYSLKNAIENLYTDEVQDSFHILGLAGKREWFAFYFIENALFRIGTLWDVLAHFYNIKYELGKEIDEVYLKGIFSTDPNRKRSCWGDNLPKDVEKIIAYLNEEDDTDIEGKWKGNYKNISSMRNKMIHQVCISQSSISNYVSTIKEPPSYLLKRLCEDYAMLENFIVEVCNSILEENNLSLDNGDD